MKHQLAMEVGIKAALLELLKKFEPRNFSQKYEEGIVVRRRSKCWDAYCTAYDKLAGEALDGLFGDAFVRAYEEHLGRLDGDRAEGRHSRGHGSGE